MVAGVFFFLVLAVILDFRTFRIPNALTMTGMAVGVIYQLYRAGPPGMLGSVKDFAGSILFLLPLYMIKCLGAGDIKLLSVIAIFLGWKQGMIISIYSLFAGAAIGILKGSIMFAFRRKKFADQQVFLKSKGKGVNVYSAGKAEKKTFLLDKINREEVPAYLKKYTWFLRYVNKKRQKVRNHIEQIRSANQLMKRNRIYVSQKDHMACKRSKNCRNKLSTISNINNKNYICNKSNKGNHNNKSNKYDQIGENDLNLNYLNPKNLSNLLNNNYQNRKNIKYIQNIQDNHNTQDNHNIQKNYDIQNKYGIQINHNIQNILNIRNFQNTQNSIDNLLSFQSRYFSKIWRSVVSKKQTKHKKKTGDQEWVIHYSLAILIAFLIARLR